MESPQKLKLTASQAEPKVVAAVLGLVVATIRNTAVPRIAAPTAATAHAAVVGCGSDRIRLR